MTKLTETIRDILNCMTAKSVEELLERFKKEMDDEIKGWKKVFKIGIYHCVVGSGWIIFCDTLEDRVRDLYWKKKIAGKTVISVG